jgi:serine/threonine-protein kinase
MLTAHVYREPPGLPPIAGLPPSVADLCARCLTKNPSDRPDAASMAAVLGEAAGIEPPSPLLPASGAGADAPPTVALAAATAPRPWHRRRSLLAGTVAALLALAGLATWFGTRAGTPAVQAMDQRPVSVPCTVTYAIRSALNGRYAAAVSVRNTGPVAVSPWRLTFALAGGQKLVGGSGWAQNGRSMQTGGDSLAAGASASSTFDATYQDSTPLPGQFALNGTVCEAQLSVDGRTVAPAAPVQAATDGRSGDGIGGGSGPGNSGSGSSASGSSASGSSTSGSSGSGSGSSGDNGNGNGKSKDKDKDNGKVKEDD